jgi:hypothetical protein
MVHKEHNHVCRMCGRGFYTPPHRAGAQYCSIQCQHDGLCNTYSTELIDKFSIPEPNSGCWLWIGAIGNAGYGVIRVERRMWGAHRLSYTLHKGPVALGLRICHTCDNRACVNPDHLYAGTAAQNTGDASRRGRMERGSARHCSVLSERQIPEIRKMLRNGLTCIAIAQQFGVDSSTISHIKRGLTWRHV